jgi:hypothetical protein
MRGPSGNNTQGPTTQSGRCVCLETARFSQAGDGWITAANGDTLTADFTGEAQVGPIISILEHATITGGTGRFAGAAGNFHRPPVVRSGQRHDHRFVRGDHFGTWGRKVVRQKRRRAPARRLGGGRPQFIGGLDAVSQYG